jgi:type II secretory pathway component PulF
MRPLADRSTTTVTTHSSAESTATWLCIAAGIHLVLWGVLFWYLFAYVPRQSATFQDFGVPVSAESLAVISLSDFIAAYWHVAAPLVLIIVVGVDYLIVSLFRSPVVRATLIALLVVPPIGLVARWNLVLLRDLSGLMEPLR